MTHFFLLLLLLLQTVVTDNKVTLQWDANTETDLAGYKVYVGHASRVYDPPIATVAVSPSPTYTVENLSDGTYYFAVTAFNTAGEESAYSNEVSATIVLSTISFDINNDGVVNIIDVQLEVNAILTSIGGADLNSDGTINVVDLQLLVNKILSGE